MPFDIEKKLVVAVASSALFDLEESDGIYKDKGVEAYREYQRQNEDKPLSPGIAFPFVRRLLKINTALPEEAPIEVILLSRNDPDTGQRVLASTEHHGLDITRGSFRSGASPQDLMEAYNVSLFLSANSDDVRETVVSGHPGGLVLGSPLDDEDEHDELRVAFDFDGVLADDEAEAVYHETSSVDAFHAAEAAKKEIPHTPGPLEPLFRRLAALQKEISEGRLETNDMRIRIAIITARNAPSHKRVVTTLREWNVQPDETHFLGGIEKERILKVFRPHMFFDDQLTHLKSGSAYGAMVHIPFGIKND